MKRFLCISLVAGSGMALGHSASACDVEHVVKPGETLSTIAERHYDSAGKWTDVYEANLSVIGRNPNTLSVGKRIILPCDKPVEEVVAAVPAPATPADAPETVSRLETSPLSNLSAPRIRMITGDHLPPLVGRALMGGGLMTEVVEAAMTASVGSLQFETLWAPSWNEQLVEEIDSYAVEMAFPYAAPDCGATPQPAVCAEYYYSQPIFEYLELLYVDSQAPIAFTQDSDLEGRKLCRPQGVQNHFLDAEGRNWLKESKIDFVQPPIATDCFFMLISGDVEGVILNEFTAREKLSLMGLADRVVPVEQRPVAISSQHVMIKRDHPKADSLLETVNSGLESIRADGSYREIVARHLEHIWSQFQGG